MNGRPTISLLSPAEIEDLMARQSLDIALDVLGPAEVLRIIADRTDQSTRPGLRPG